ncbi:MAG: redox-sensitive transcriptional activator SoxR [Solirubrobacteraceae bacterium]|nr:redox-sensitive transcriptional activator SoxR [Solirubrobacteraceae bacterium]
MVEVKGDEPNSADGHAAPAARARTKAAGAPPSRDNLLSIGEVAKRCGVAVSALRFYEDRGLIESERSGAGKRRQYRRTVLRRVAFIVFAQRVGFSLGEITELLGRLPAGRTPTAKDWAALTPEWEARLDERQAELDRLRVGLENCIGCGCLSMTRCAMSNPGDRAALGGPGPARWR